MAQYIDKDALVAEIEKWRDGITKGIFSIPLTGSDRASATFEYEILGKIKDFLDTLEVKEVDNVWHEVDNVNLPQPDKNKIYCVLSKNKYLLARVINHPHDELLQWSCTEFPFHCYDMCEGDKYMQIG